MKKLNILLCVLTSLNLLSALQIQCYRCIYDLIEKTHNEACKSEPTDVPSDDNNPCYTQSGCVMEFSSDGSRVVRRCPRLPTEVNNGTTGCSNPTAGLGLQCFCDWSNCNNLDQNEAENIENYRPSEAEIIESNMGSTPFTSTSQTSTVEGPTDKAVGLQALGLSIISLAVFAWKITSYS